MKGVDFLLIIHYEKLILVEVKNFNNRFEKDHINPTETFLDNLDPFFNAFVDKFNDTLQAIRVVQAYYARRWWFRYMARPFARHFPAAWWTRFEWGRWHLMYLLSVRQQVEPVVVLSYDHHLPLDRERIRHGFERKMAATATIPRGRLIFVDADVSPRLFEVLSREFPE
ncbi:MAG: hypothetical protein D6714_04525 [Bacteroidetes bacterium]|nr:MAG: hypothetical protein D6714_04525 [Bacteroidota bacterium]